MTSLQDRGADGPDLADLADMAFGRPQPSMYGSLGRSSAALAPSHAAPPPPPDADIQGAGPRSAGPPHPQPQHPPGAPYAGAAPRPYAPSHDSGVHSSVGPSPYPMSQQHAHPAQAPSVLGSQAPSAFGDRAPPSLHASSASLVSPPQPYGPQAGPSQLPPQSQPRPPPLQQHYTQYSGAASSIFSSPSGMPGPGSAPTTPGAYYATSSNSSGSGGPQAQQGQWRPQAQQARPLGAASGSVFSAASFSHGPQHHGSTAPPSGPSHAAGGGTGPFSRPPPSMVTSMSDDGSGSHSRMATVGKMALGALAAAGAVYGAHTLMEGSEDDKKKKKEELLRRKRIEDERARRENEARRHRESEERRRREEHERRQREDEERYTQSVLLQSQHSQSQAHIAPQPQPLHPNQQVYHNPGQPLHQSQPQLYPHSHHSYPLGGQQSYAPSVHSFAASAHQQSELFSSAHSLAARRRSDSFDSASRHSHSSDGFQPPAPFGRPPYTFSPRDVRRPDPTRSSERSATAETYPQLRQKPDDTKIKIGTILALKHIATGRHLRTDRSHSTQSGSNHQLVYAHQWSPGEADEWQVLPANTDTPVPGALVAYGTQIRLRHLETGRHLHSHYGFADPLLGQNEVVAFGDQANSDENDHWVVERWGDGAYGQTWRLTDPIVLRHYVSGMVLRCHDLQAAGDIFPVTCTGSGNNENDKWRVVLDV
ncbi:hypothetical protein H4R18_005470 [Coemansia javaensis]|uniref:MIR domain-containing protein n=1 Tax=Coemansia javaensis TaxID=2761396 RepID=A0A9W8H324_9FUNG|nr:hypothetical protein H4R18_005470 [Coemansia javaensis]